MPNFAYTNTAQLMNNGQLDHREAGADIRIRKVMSASTAGSEFSVSTVGGFTDFDEYDGANYAAQTCNNQITTQDDPNRRSEFSHDVSTFPNMGAGSRQAVAHVYVRFVDGGNGDIPLYYVDTGGYPYDGNGGDVTITPNAQGAQQVRAAP